MGLPPYLVSSALTLVVVLQVTDIVGKTVYTESFRGFGAGLNTINLNTANFATGVYNYSIITNEAKVTKQMIVR